MRRRVQSSSVCGFRGRKVGPSVSSFLHPLRGVERTGTRTVPNASRPVPLPLIPGYTRVLGPFPGHFEDALRPAERPHGRPGETEEVVK